MRIAARFDAAHAVCRPTRGRSATESRSTTTRSRQSAPTRAVPHVSCPLLCCFHALVLSTFSLGFADLKPSPSANNLQYPAPRRCTHPSLRQHAAHIYSCSSSHAARPQLLMVFGHDGRHTAPIAMKPDVVHAGSTWLTRLASHSWFVDHPHTWPRPSCCPSDNFKQQE